MHDHWLTSIGFERTWQGRLALVSFLQPQRQWESEDLWPWSSLLNTAGHPFDQNKRQLHFVNMVNTMQKNHVQGWIMLKSLLTTVATPLKKWGLIDPSIWCDLPRADANMLIGWRLPHYVTNLERSQKFLLVWKHPRVCLPDTFHLTKRFRYVELDPCLFPLKSI